MSVFWRDKDGRLVRRDLPSRSAEQALRQAQRIRASHYRAGAIMALAKH